MNTVIMAGIIIVITVIILMVIIAMKPKKEEASKKETSKNSTHPDEFTWDKEQVYISHRNTSNIIPKSAIGDIHFFKLDSGQGERDVMAILFLDHDGKVIDGTIGEWDIDEIINKFRVCRYPIEVKPLPVKLYIYDQVVAALDHRKRDLLLNYWQNYKICEANHQTRDFSSIDSEFYLILSKGFIALPHHNQLEIGELSYVKAS